MELPHLNKPLHTKFFTAFKIGICEPAATIHINGGLATEQLRQVGLEGRLEDLLNLQIMSVTLYNQLQTNQRAEKEEVQPLEKL